MTLWQDVRGWLTGETRQARDAAMVQAGMDRAHAQWVEAERRVDGAHQVPTEPLHQAVAIQHRLSAREQAAMIWAQVRREERQQVLTQAATRASLGEGQRQGRPAWRLGR